MVHLFPLRVVHLKPFWVVQLNRCHQLINVDQRDDYSYGVCLKGPDRTQFARLILCGLNKQYQELILQKYSNYPYLLYQITHIFKIINELSIDVIIIDKLEDFESKLNQFCNKRVDESSGKRIILFFDDVITNQDTNNIRVFQTLTEHLPSRTKVLTTNNYEIKNNSIGVQPLELIYHHGHDFTIIYVHEITAC